MRELHLFAGAGGGILGGILLGHTTVCAVEIEPYCREVLLQRQRDGILPKFPIWDDIRTFDGKPWKGLVDVVCGGFPCQDISIAGKGAGIEGERSGLWSEMRRIICEVEPDYVFVENSPMLTIRGLGTVLRDLAEMGFNARWGVLGADDTGGPHIRKRIWILGFNPNKGNAGGVGSDCRKDSDSAIRQTTKDKQKGHGWEHELGAVDVAQRISSYGDALRVLHGMASRVDRLKAIGNGQVPIVAATAWRLLTEGL
jgi:DNA (cytosine-5)-methyltransferase 1